VQMFFVATDDPLINVSRVVNRMAKGGHDVPVDKIIEPYKRVLDMLPDALRLCDAATIFDNSDITIKPWLTTMRQGDRLVVLSGNIAQGSVLPKGITEDVPGSVMNIFKAIKALSK
jgi:predicted ABC-type ATPase